jgi:hypothetical protein
MRLDIPRFGVGAFLLGASWALVLASLDYWTAALAAALFASAGFLLVAGVRSPHEQGGDGCAD